MSFAFLDGPFSGRTRPARMCRGASKAEGSIWTARSGSGSGLGPREPGRTLAQEGLDALHEVARRGHLLLDRGLELELLVHARVEPRVELALGARVGPRGPRGEALGQRVDLGLEGDVGRHAVDQSPLERLGRRDPLAQHRHLGRARVPDRSEEHTSELQSHSDLVCRLLLEKKKEYLRRLSKHIKKKTTYMKDN